MIWKSCGLRWVYGAPMQFGELEMIWVDRILGKIGNSISVFAGMVCGSISNFLEP